MTVISTGNHPKALWEGMRRWWGREYDKHPKFHTAMFEVIGSKKAYEEDAEVTGFGLAPVKTQGGSISFDSETQGTVTKYTHVAYALGWIATFEEQQDCLYEVVGRRRTTALAFSMETTRQIVASNFFNRGFNSLYTYGDAKEAFATDHPTVDGTQSNELNPSADFSEATLEDLLIQVMNAKNSRGLNIVLRPNDLVIPTALAFEATRVLKSEYQNDTANNAVNAIRTMGLLGKAPIVNPYLTDSDAYFVKTNCPNGAIFMNRQEMMFDQDNDFNTKNAKAASYMRFSVGHTDFRGYYASAGI
nr:hypothetical protein [uncultured archaeon]